MIYIKRDIPANSQFQKKLQMGNRINGLIGIGAVILSTITIIVMAELRTDGYDHFHKAVSELGAIDAPNKWVFNIFGYILPGALIAAFSYNLLNYFRSYPVKSYPFYLLIISGLLMSVAGFFPVDMDNRQAVSSIIHTMGSLGAGVSWLLCALTLWWQLKKNDSWKLTAIVTLIVPFLMIISMSFVSENSPGFSQRIAFGFNYLFILILAYKQFFSSYLAERNDL